MIWHRDKHTLLVYLVFLVSLHSSTHKQRHTRAHTDSCIRERKKLSLASNSICLIYINTKYQFTLLNHFDHHYSHIFGLLSPFSQSRIASSVGRSFGWLVCRRRLLDYSPVLTLHTLLCQSDFGSMFTIYIICYAWYYNHVFKIATVPLRYNSVAAACSEEG